MKFEFGYQSRLHGRPVTKPIDRISFVPQSEEGLIEYIFAYKDKIPDDFDEPKLYHGAVVNNVGPKEKKLVYPGIDEVIIMLTLEEDNRFRAENPKVVDENELFKIE